MTRIIVYGVALSVFAAALSCQQEESHGRQEGSWLQNHEAPDDTMQLCDRGIFATFPGAIKGLKLIALLAIATILTIVSILTTHWLDYEIHSTNTDTTFRHTLGLHQSCTSSSDPACRPFPDRNDCKDDTFFCSMWRSSGFLLSFATIVELATVVSFVVVMAGGKFKREDGWKLVGSLLLADAAVEFVGMGLVAYLFNNDSQFVGSDWSLGWSWILCTISASVSVILAASLAISAWVLPSEDDYEPLGDGINDI